MGLLGGVGVGSWYNPLGPEKSVEIVEFLFCFGVDEGLVETRVMVVFWYAIFKGFPLVVPVGCVVEVFDSRWTPVLFLFFH